MAREKWEALPSEMVDIDSVMLDPANARKHNERNLNTIKASLAQFGQQRPILVNEKNIIMAGNGTWQGAKALGWQKIWIIRSDLLGANQRAYGITDNRSAELAEWDMSALGQLLKGLDEEDFNLDLTGFEIGELGEMFPDGFGVGGGSGGDSDRDEKEDDVQPPPKEPRSKLGDMYILGGYYECDCGERHEL